MKTLRIALGSFLLGAALSFAPLVTYACASMIWVQDDGNCNSYHRYNLNGSSSNGHVEVCSYAPAGGSAHIESGNCEDLPYIF